MIPLVRDEQIDPKALKFVNRYGSRLLINDYFVLVIFGVGGVTEG